MFGWRRGVLALGVVLALVPLSACHDEDRSAGAFSLDEMRALEEKAGRGDAESEYMLGIVQQQGLGVPVDMAKAVEWFKRAAEHGSGRAEMVLGWISEQGDGVPRNVNEAARWYQRAAVRGMTEAQFCLAELYRRGEGVKQDSVQALRWYMLADQGSPRIKEAGHEGRKLMETMSPVQIAEGQRLAALGPVQPADAAGDVGGTNPR